MSDARTVPDVADLATARALITTLHDELTKVQRENAALRHQLDVLCQRLFGKKSERVDPRQLQLALEQLANEPGPVSEPVELDSGETPVLCRIEMIPPPHQTISPDFLDGNDSLVEKGGARTERGPLYEGGL